MLQLAKSLRWATLITGHIGCAGRGAFFLLVSILMFRSVSDSTLGSEQQNSFGNALSGLRVGTCLSPLAKAMLSDLHSQYKMEPLNTRYH